MVDLVDQLNKLRSRRSKLVNQLAEIDASIFRLEDEIGDNSIKSYFAKHPDLEPLSFGDKVLDNRGIYLNDNVWIVHSVADDEGFNLRLPDHNRSLLMVAHYEWLMEMRKAYLELSIADNSPSKG